MYAYVSVWPPAGTCLHWHAYRQPHSRQPVVHSGTQRTHTEQRLLFVCQIAHVVAALAALIFTKFTQAEMNYVHISYAKFHRNRTVIFENADIK